MTKLNIRKCRDYIEHFLCIRNKKGEKCPFILNQPQQVCYETIARQWRAGQPVRLVIALGYPKPGDPLRPKKRKELRELVTYQE